MTILTPDHVIVSSEISAPGASTNSEKFGAGTSISETVTGTGSASVSEATVLGQGASAAISVADGTATADGATVLGQGASISLTRTGVQTGGSADNCVVLGAGASIINSAPGVTTDDCILIGAGSQIRGTQGSDHSRIIAIGTGIDAATGNEADAIMIGTNANGAARSVAIGLDALASSQDVAVGWLAVSGGGTAVGLQTTANGGTALGRQAVATVSGVAVGYQANCGNQIQTVSVGQNALTASAVGGVAIGFSARASGAGSIAIGKGANGGGSGNNTTILIGTDVGLAPDTANLIVIGSDGTYTGQHLKQSVVLGHDLSITTAGVNGDSQDMILVGHAQTLALTRSGTGNSTAVGLVMLGANATATATSVDGTSSIDRSIVLGEGASVTATSNLTNTGTVEDAVVIGANSSIDPTTNGVGNGTVILGANIATARSEAVIVGLGAAATGNRAVAIGTGSTAGGEQVALGYQASATGSQDVAIGRGVTTSGGGNVVVGGSAAGSLSNAVAIGLGSNARNGSVSIGSSAGIGSGNATVDGVTIGRSSQSWDRCIVIGALAQATINTDDSIVIGNSARLGTSFQNPGAQYNVMVGHESRLGRHGSNFNVMVGARQHLHVASTLTVVNEALGAGDTVTITTSTTGNGVATVFTEGVDFNKVGGDNDLTAEAIRVALLTIAGLSVVRTGATLSITGDNTITIVNLTDGGSGAWTTTLGTAPAGAVLVGEGVEVIGGQNIAIGQFSQTTGGTRNIAIGSNATAADGGSGPSVAIGDESDAIGISSVAVGRIAQATNTTTTAVGSAAVATGLQSSAFGASASATGSQCTVLGRNASDGGFNTTVVIGENSEALGASAVVVGRDAEANGASTAIGNFARVNGAGSGIAIGHSALVAGANQCVLGAPGVPIRTFIPSAGDTHTSSPGDCTWRLTDIITTANLGGPSLTIRSGRGTGTGTESTITFQTPDLTGAGSTQQPLVTRMTIGPSGVTIPGGVSSSGPGSFDYLNVGATTTAAASGDLAAGAGAGDQFFWDASTNELILDATSNATTGIRVRQNTTGTAAQSRIIVQADTGASLGIHVASSSWTSGGGLIPDGALIRSDSNLSGGLTVGTLAAAPFNLRTTDVDRWRINSAGHFLAVADNAYDIGASGATRPRRVYVGTSAFVGATSAFAGYPAGFSSTDEGDIVGSTPSGALAWDASAATLYVDGATATITTPREDAGVSLVIRTVNGGLANAGSVSVIAGNGGTTNGNGGHLILTSGRGQTNGTFRDSGHVSIRAQNALGTGADGQVRLGTNFGTSDEGWRVAGGHLLAGFAASRDNVQDIGASGTNRPRTGYFGTSLNVGNGITPSTTNGSFVVGTSDINKMEFTGSLFAVQASSSGVGAKQTGYFQASNSGGAGGAGMIAFNAFACETSASTPDQIVTYGAILRTTGAAGTNYADFFVDIDRAGTGTRAFLVGNSQTATGAYRVEVNGGGIMAGAIATITAAESGDIVAGDGTREMFWDASTAFLTVDEPTASSRSALYATNDSNQGVALWCNGSTKTPFAAYDPVNAGILFTDSPLVNGLTVGTSAGKIRFTTALTNRWEVSATGHFLADLDNTYDIGASGATRPRSGYFGTSLNVGTANNSFVYATGGQAIVTREDAGTANLVTCFTSKRTSTNTVGVGFGSSIQYSAEDAGGGASAQASLDAYWTTATGGSATANYGIRLRESGVLPAEGSDNFTFRGADNVFVSTGGVEVGSPAATAALGDIVAGDGTREMFWDVSLNTMFVGAEATKFTLQGFDATTAATQGTEIDIEGGRGNTSGAGGDVDIRGGIAGVTGAGGAVRLLSGGGGSTSGASGVIQILCGTAVNGSGGQLNMKAGDAGTAGSGGPVFITAGNGAGASTGGDISIQTGDGGATGNGGPLAISTGDGGSTSGNSGSITMDAGAVTSGTTGSIDIGGTNASSVSIGRSAGNLGFYGATPVAQSAAYTVTNVVTDRAYDANATTVNELADVLGTLIADLKALGLIG